MNSFVLQYIVSIVKIFEKRLSEIEIVSEHRIGRLFRHKVAINDNLRIYQSIPCLIMTNCKKQIVVIDFQGLRSYERFHQKRVSQIFSKVISPGQSAAVVTVLLSWHVERFCLYKRLYKQGDLRPLQNIRLTIESQSDGKKTLDIEVQLSKHFNEFVNQFQKGFIIRVLCELI